MDSIRDDSVYKSVGGDKSDSNMSWNRTTTASSNLSKLRIKLQHQTHGMTSEQISNNQDPLGKINGGNIADCLQYEYERDYILESVLNDKLY